MEHVIKLNADQEAEIAKAKEEFDKWPGAFAAFRIFVEGDTLQVVGQFDGPALKALNLSDQKASQCCIAYKLAEMAIGNAVGQAASVATAQVLIGELFGLGQQNDEKERT